MIKILTRKLGSCGQLGVRPEKGKVGQTIGPVQVVPLTLVKTVHWLTGSFAAQDRECSLQ